MNFIKTLLVFFLVAAMSLFAISCLTGCAHRPIKTTLDYGLDASGVPAINYSSEKDVVYTVTTTDAETGDVVIVEFKALSSAAAYAQAERDATQARLTESAVNALINGTATAAGAAIPGR